MNDVRTVEEFLDRYYRHDRYRGRGEEYAAVVLQSHRDRFARLGYDLISRHESRTGEPVWFGGDE